MQLDPELIDELSLLRRISQDSSLDVANLRSSGDPGVSAAAERLVQKGILSETGDFQLTESGVEAADHMNRLFNLLSPPLEPI
ncbi:MAG: TIGR02647 family protein [Gammaproteobacteria bacterium]|nr:TIGR02647 family protein [Gammaproteobacteria bacterium]MCZ6798117.1 TIGR02647 family protein [Gammaproteobacteria bacterium]